MVDIRADFTYRAKLAEQAERYNDMANFMRNVAQIDGTLNSEERNLLSVAYKNVVGAHRTSWRVLSSLQKKDDVKRELVESYSKKVEAELCAVCQDVLVLIEDYVLPNSCQLESKVFFLKMMGDYYRYLAEVKHDDLSSKHDLTQKSKEAYMKATEAGKELPKTNPIILGLALNFSVFYYEILNESGEACKLAKTAFESAVAELDQVEEESYKEITVIMQLLRDNLTSWASGGQDDEEADNEQ